MKTLLTIGLTFIFTLSLANAQQLIITPTGGFLITDSKGNYFTARTITINGNFIIAGGVDGKYEGNDTSATQVSFGETSNQTRLLAAEDLYLRDDQGNFVKFSEFATARESNGRHTTTGRGADISIDGTDLSAARFAFINNPDGSKQLGADNFFFRDQDGNFISSRNISINKLSDDTLIVDTTQTSGAYNGNFASSDRLRFIQHNDGTKRLDASGIYLQDLDGNFISARNVTYLDSDERRELGLSDINGKYHEVSGSAAAVGYTEVGDGAKTISASQFFIADASSGDFLNADRLSYSEIGETKLVSADQIDGRYMGDSAAAERFRFESTPDSTRLNTTNFRFNLGSGESGAATSLDYSNSAHHSTLFSSGLSLSFGETDFSSSTFNVDQSKDHLRADGTNIALSNNADSLAADRFLLLSEEDRKALESEGLSFSYQGYDFTSETFNASENGDTISADGTGLSLRDPHNSGTADSFTFITDGTLSAVTTEGLTLNYDGYDFASETFNASQNGDTIAADGTGVSLSNPNDSLTATSFAFITNENRTDLTSNELTFSYDGYDFTSDTFNATKEGDRLSADGTNVFLTNSRDSFGAERFTFNLDQEEGSLTADGTGISLRDPDNALFADSFTLIADDERKDLATTGLTFDYEGYNFSSDTFNLAEADGTVTSDGTNIALSDSDNLFTLGRYDMAHSDQRTLFWGDDLAFSNHNFGFSNDSFRLDRNGNLVNYFGTGIAFNFGLDGIEGDGTASTLDLIYGPGRSIASVTELDSSVYTVNGQGDTIKTDIDAESLSLSRDDVDGSTTLSGETVNINSGYGASVDLDNASVTQYDGSSSLDLSFDGVIHSTDIPAGYNGAEVGADIEKFQGYSLELGQHSGAAAILTDADGGISHVYAQLGNDIKFEATDKDGNARELTAAYHWDPKEKRFLLEMKLVDGDKVSVKVFPFKFESEKVSNDAIAKLSAQLNNQNMQEYLDFVTGMLDFQQINSFLALGPGQMKISLGSHQGLELIYRDQSSDFTSGLGRERSKAFGAGFFRNTSKGGRNSAGIILSADSSFTYEIHSGKASIAGITLPDRAEIPLTTGLYFSSVDAEGNAIFATAGVPLGNLDAIGTFGAGYKKQLGERTSITFSGSANTEGDFGVGVRCTITFGAIPKISSNFSNAMTDFMRKTSSDRLRDVAQWNRDIKGY